jgi:hypothetical protein
MAMTLISTSTADGSANIAITSGIDSTYKLYIIQCINVNLVAANQNYLTHQFSTDGGSSYGVTTTSTLFRAYNFENDSGAALGYLTTQDLAQSTAYQPWSDGLNNDDDQGFAATLWLFNPSNTTYVKHWYGRGVGDYGSPLALNAHLAGYVNTTSAVNAIDFKALTGNIDEGTFKLYGVG